MYACDGHDIFIPTSPPLSCCSTTCEVLIKAEPYAEYERLNPGFSPRRTGIVPRVIYMEFWWAQEHWDRLFLSTWVVAYQLSFNRRSIFIYLLPGVWVMTPAGAPVLTNVVTFHPVIELNSILLITVLAQPP
jgi:hypothetical protein